MKSRIRLVMSLFAMLTLIVSISSVSMAWYSVVSKANRSLDYVVFSSMVIQTTIDNASTQSRVIPAKAVKGAVGAGMDVSNVFGASNIAQKATIGASEHKLRYFSEDTGTGRMQIHCTLSAIDNEGNRFFDIDQDVGYMVCVSGSSIAMDRRWVVNGMPNTACWIAKDGEFTPFALDPAIVYYTISSNASHEELLNYFGVDNYVQVCVYDPASEQFSAWWTKEDEDYAHDDTFASDFLVAYNAGTHSFTHNNLLFAWEQNEGMVTVYSDSTVGQIETTSEMQITFLVIMWFRRVDELLDPVMTGKSISLSAVVDTGGE